MHNSSKIRENCWLKEFQLILLLKMYTPFHVIQTKRLKNAHTGVLEAVVYGIIVQNCILPSALYTISMWEKYWESGWFADNMDKLILYNVVAMILFSQNTTT